jgi:hypothetical protein
MNVLAIGLIVFVLNAASLSAVESRLQTFDILMVRSTFKVQSGNSVGTAFILLQPVPGRTNSYSYVMVTAAHVLLGMPSSNAVLFIRMKIGDRYDKTPWTFPIRANGTNLWTQHPKADVAAIRIALPQSADIGGISTDFLANDKFLNDFLVHPGDELRVLGYPYAFEANEAGFPILRSGRIASFPLTPTAKTRTFLLDFRVFKGNSGGPVYLLDHRQMEEGAITTINISCLVGLISEEATVTEQLSGLTESTIRTHQLGLGVVIHAQMIKETIELLPPWRNL